MKVKRPVHIICMIVIVLFFIGCEPAKVVPVTPIFDNTKVELLLPIHTGSINTSGSFTWDEPADCDCVLGVFSSNIDVSNDGVMNTFNLLAGSKSGNAGFGAGTVRLDDLFLFNPALNGGDGDFDTAQPVDASVAAGTRWAVWCFKNSFLSHSSPPFTVTITW